MRFAGCTEKCLDRGRKRYEGSEKPVYLGDRIVGGGAREVN